MKFLVAKVSLALGALLFLFLIGEIAARFYVKSVNRTGVTYMRSLNPRHYFGWQGRQSIGDLASTRKRLLVVGDSMTHGAGLAREDELYYAVLGRLLDVETFAYGGEGFGTLQEYLVIDRYLPLVKPDLVVLQTCSNDIINNSWELESRSHFNNNLQVRPYLEGDRIRYRFPSRFGNYGPILGYSRLAYWLSSQAAKVTAGLARKGIIASTETDITDPQDARLQRAAATTEAIVVKLKTSLKGIPLVAFAGDPVGPFWVDVFDRQGVPFFNEIAAEVEQAERRLGRSIRPDGSHWDAEGHRVVGQALARWLATK